MQGVIGVYSRKGAARKGLYILYGVQHRGQEGAGISAASDHSLRTWKGKGLVSNVFDERYASFMHPEDYLVIGCASGEPIVNGVLPPYPMDSGRYSLSLTMDGFIPGRGGRTNEEAFGGVLMENLKREEDIEEALSDTMDETPRAYYSLVLAAHDKRENRSTLIAARDRRGLRPLYIASNGEEHFVASESASIAALENMGIEIHGGRDLAPGSMAVMDEGGLAERRVLEPRPAHCAFEWVYFGRPDSVIEGRNVHAVRKRLGHALVETHRLKEAYGIEYEPREGIAVIPVPDSGRSVCTGVAEALRVTPDEGVIKNAYLGRTYIINDPGLRRTASDLKHNIIREAVEGMKVVITDDSIVRGTVSESIAKSLIKAGASEVEFLVSYAPIYHPCFSDLPDKPLAAAPHRGRSLKEVGDLVAENLPSINRVRYNSPENVVKSIGLPEEEVCIYCITGRNPFEVEQPPEADRQEP